MIAKLHHGHLTHADGNGDWVLMMFTALSLVSYLYRRVCRCLIFFIFYFLILICRIHKLFMLLASFVCHLGDLFLSCFYIGI